MVPLKGEKDLKPRSHPIILKPLGGSFQNFRRVPPSFLFGTALPVPQTQTRFKHFPNSRRLLSTPYTAYAYVSSRSCASESQSIEPVANVMSLPAKTALWWF